MNRGAKHVVFISRSGADKPEAAQLIESITKAGAIPQVFYGDTSNADEVFRAIETVTKKRKIKGVVHAAIVLEVRSSTFSPSIFCLDLTSPLGRHARPQNNTREVPTRPYPKFRGAKTLHTCLTSHDLNFLVMTSSISATIGQPGQSNYAAANSFLDNLAYQRQLAGLLGVSRVLPMVLGIGVQLRGRQDLPTRSLRRRRAEDAWGLRGRDVAARPFPLHLLWGHPR